MTEWGLMTRARIGVALGVPAFLTVLVLLGIHLVSAHQGGTSVVHNVPVELYRYRSAPVQLADGRFIFLASAPGSDGQPTLKLIGRDHSIVDLKVDVPGCSDSTIEDVRSSRGSIYLSVHCYDGADTWFGRYDVAQGAFAQLRDVSAYEDVAVDEGQLIATTRSYDRDYSQYITPRCPSLAVGSIDELEPIPPLTVAGNRPPWPVDIFLSGSCSQYGFVQDVDRRGSTAVVIAGANPVERGGCTSDGVDQLCELYWIDLRTNTIWLVSRNVGYAFILAVSDDMAIVTGTIAGDQGMWEFDRHGMKKRLYSGPYPLRRCLIVNQLLLRRPEAVTIRTSDPSTCLS
jgi:hypothetical protein